MQLLAILTLVLLYVPYGICFSFPLKLTRKHALSMNAVREHDSISALRKCGAATATCAAIFWGSFLPLTDYATSKGASTAVVHAAVGEGDLPDGAMAFQKILKFKNDWKTVADRVKSQENKLDNKETMAIKVFLKQLGNEYNDMELLRRGILDSAKSDRAQVIAKEFRKLVRECDDAASDGNVGKITENFSNVAGLMDEYLSLLQDVPDEL